MSKAPRGEMHHAPTSAPYTKGDHIKRITSLRALDATSKRLKKMPPDAKAEAADGYQFYQLDDMVLFTCHGCRRDNVRSDAIAAHRERGTMLCTKCLVKLIRPRQFRPTRLVPFPTLLSWLNYKPPNVVSAPDAKVSQRPAEAVAPSGDRMAVGGFTGGASDLRALPASAMVHSVTSQDARAVDALKEMNLTHPCVRLWGGCKHGSMCLLLNAPRRIAVEFLMGIATCEAAVRDGLIAEAALDLPQTADPMPPIQSLHADLADANSPLSQWLSRRRRSLNKVEWQLFNNGPVEAVFAAYCRPQTVTEEEMEDDDLGAALDAL